MPILCHPLLTPHPWATPATSSTSLLSPGRAMLDPCGLQPSVDSVMKLERSFSWAAQHPGSPSRDTHCCVHTPLSPHPGTSRGQGLSLTRLSPGANAGLHTVGPHRHAEALDVSRRELTQAARGPPCPSRPHLAPAGGLGRGEQTSHKPGPGSEIREE